MKEHERKYAIVVKKERIEVTEEIYKSYYRLVERQRYLDKLAEKKHISIEACHENGVQVEYIISQAEESIEDSIIKRELLKELMLCLEMLSEQERMLIYALYFENKTETMLAAEWKINQSSISRRKVKILSKLKKFLEV